MKIIAVFDQKHGLTPLEKFDFKDLLKNPLFFSTESLSIFSRHVSTEKK